MKVIQTTIILLALSYCLLEWQIKIMQHQIIETNHSIELLAKAIDAHNKAFENVSDALNNHSKAIIILSKR